MVSIARASLIAAALVLPVASHAKKNKIQTTNLADATYTVEVALADTIGPLTDVQVEGDTLYAAGQSGIAALSADGGVLWSVELPLRMMRNIDVADGKVAYTAFSLEGVEPGKGLVKFLIGAASDAPVYEAETLGLVEGGALAWSHDIAGSEAMSPPSFGADRLAVNYGGRIEVYDHAGELVGTSRLPSSFTSGLDNLMAGIRATATRTKPAYFGDGFYASWLGRLTKVDLQGNEAWGGMGFSLFVPFRELTANPHVWGDRMYLGNANLESEGKEEYFAIREKRGEPDKAWRVTSPGDYKSGVGNFANNDTLLFASTNFYLHAFDPKNGKEKWTAVNKKGGLYPSGSRGVRFANNSPTLKSYGEFLVATNERVLLSNSAGEGKADGIAVLQASSGKYVQTISVNAPLVDMTMFGDKLVIATPDGLGLAVIP